MLCIRPLRGNVAATFFLENEITSGKTTKMSSGLLCRLCYIGKFPTCTFMVPLSFPIKKEAGQAYGQWSAKGDDDIYEYKKTESVQQRCDLCGTDCRDKLPVFSGKRNRIAGKNILSLPIHLPGYFQPEQNDHPADRIAGRHQCPGYFCLPSPRQIRNHMLCTCKQPYFSPSVICMKGYVLDLQCKNDDFPFIISLLPLKQNIFSRNDGDAVRTRTGICRCSAKKNMDVWYPGGISML